VTGIIGCIQALEAIKVLSGCGGMWVHTYICLFVNIRVETLHGKLLFFDGVSSVFRTVKLRTKQPSCVVCGTNPTITEKLPDYPMFCSAPYSDKVFFMYIFIFITVPSYWVRQHEKLVVCS
jgi:hypothetical protein